MTAQQVLVAAVSALLLPSSAPAAGVDEKALLTPYPQSNLISEKVSEFDDYELVNGGVDSAKGACQKKQALQGRVARFYYENPKKRSHAESFANYRDAATKAGFQTIFTCKEEGCYLDVGHADAVGALDANIGLSRRRAESVVKELTTKQGIAAARLRPDGVGPLVPLASNDTDEGRAKNRRVDLVKQY
jgi:hypothetical protein